MNELSIFKNPPLVHHSHVFHVGTFDPSDKSDQGDSLEGNGLSVSLHPQEWISIARLGGRPTWKLSCLGGQGLFLDAHALTSSQLAELSDWGIAHDFVKHHARWKAIWFDCEDSSGGCPSRSWSLHSTQEAAFAEVEDLEESDVESVVVLSSTKNMVLRCGFDPGDMNAFDILKTFFAEDHGLDGVWWKDTLDPVSLSAPRGVINKASLGSWDRSCVFESKPAQRRRSP